ncbi:MAG TPA: response regulator transcription factor [Woeseiaceae bacterium]|nr:response regulator transcription factor [Woeseiaceae bacterium]
MRVLLVEDHQDIAASIYDFLEEQGYEMDAASDGITGLHLAVSNSYDVIILDLGLPGIDGVDLCRRLRDDARNPTPVLMLTARDSLHNKLEGFAAGADDYLVKPFALQELAARVKVLSERATRLFTKQLKVSDLTLDLDAHEVTRDGHHIDLNPMAFKLLTYFMQHPHRLIKREELEHAVWQDDPPDSDALRTHLSNLRNAVDKPFSQSLIHTVRGFGYRFTDQHADS